ncbi:MAG: hypothetical protein A2Y33_11260 [Spirochaetes bacterium GWF1_51_8]|nr:MAG: hypothetical protein A2Y33_11260 [Spirochaetes bacterium GWF1_51_8]
MRKGWILGILLILQSCGILMLSDKDGQLTPLAVTSGGYLSSDKDNEITPYLFRVSPGEAYLLYSSDKNGTYDIFCAKMNADGTFEPPFALPGLVNSPASDEIYPVCVSNIAKSRYTLAYLSILANVTNLVCVDVMPFTFTFTNSNTAPAINPTGLGSIFMNGQYFMMTSFGAKNFSIYNISGDTIQLYYLREFLSNTRYASGNIIENDSTNFDTIIYLKENYLAGKTQIEIELAVVTGGFMTNSFILSPGVYASSYNDSTPSMDFYCGFKLYFASDRYGKGNYDLFRYNIVTPDKMTELDFVFGLDNVRPVATVTSPTNGQTNVMLNPTLIANAFDPAPSSGVLSVWGSVNGGPFKQVFFSMYEYFTTLTSGSHSYRVFAVDKSGNYSLTNEISFEVQ